MAISDTVTITINADDPVIAPELADEQYATQAQKFASQALAAARSAGANADRIEGILAQVEDGAAFVSADEDNRLKRGTDGGLYVRDNFNPDPLAHYHANGQPISSIH